jgi:hypothetical protein
MVLPNAVDTNCSGHEEEEDQEEEAEEKRRKDKKRQTSIQSSALYGVVNSAGLQGVKRERIQGARFSPEED